MSSLPTKFDYTYNSLSIFPSSCHVPSINVALVKSNVQKYGSDSNDSGGYDKISFDREEINENFKQTEYQQIFDDFVHSEDPTDCKPRKRKQVLPEIRFDEEVDRLACVFEIELTAATPLSANGELNCPPWPLEALGKASRDQDDLDHLSCGATDCGYGNCNPPTPGEYVFKPLPDDLISLTPSEDESNSPMSTHFGSPISTLNLDSPTLGWTDDSHDLEKGNTHVSLGPIFTHFNIGGLPTPDNTPTDDCLASSYPLFTARCESPVPGPTTPSAKISRTTDSLANAPKKRSRKSTTDGETTTRKRRRD